MTILIVASCEKINTDSPYIDGLSIENYPIIDGSTSTLPLNRVIACELLGLNAHNLADWNGLVNYAATPDHLKESGTSHWLAPNTGATNSVLFTALPGGVSTGGSYFGLGQIGGFWLTREIDATIGMGFLLYYNNNPTTGDYVYRQKSWGHSVGCVKD